MRFPSPRHLPRRCCCCSDCTNTRPRHHRSTYNHAHSTHPMPTTRTQGLASSSSWPMPSPSPRHLPRRCCCCSDCTNTIPRHHGSTYNHAHNTHPIANNTHPSTCKLEFVASAFLIATPPASPMLLLFRLHHITICDPTSVQQRAHYTDWRVRTSTIAMCRSYPTPCSVLHSRHLQCHSHSI